MLIAVIAPYLLLAAAIYGICIALQEIRKIKKEEKR